MSTSTALPEIDETLLATTRYLQALTVLDDESVRRPSLLPGWSRAHVVAHLSRNADAFTRVLGQVAAGEPASMYASAEARDADIEDTVARLDLAGLVEDALASTARLTEALWACEADPDTPYTRVPGGDRTWPLHSVGPRRRAEVEIHHSDLGVGYEPATWPADFSSHLVKQRQDELADGRRPVDGAQLDGRRRALEVRRGPGARRSAARSGTWPGGWSAAATGEGLTCSAGDLPVLGRWR